MCDIVFIQVALLAAVTGASLYFDSVEDKSHSQQQLAVTTSSSSSRMIGGLTLRGSRGLAM